MIAIKGMEKLPKNCEDCPLCNEYDYECGINGYDSKTDTAKERMKNCPLVEIVTCKDCKYNVKNGYNTTTCDIGHRFYMRDHNTFYCADGERREEE